MVSRANSVRGKFKGIIIAFESSNCYKFSSSQSSAHEACSHISHKFDTLPFHRCGNAAFDIANGTH
jgi:hypothetical protein